MNLRVVGLQPSAGGFFTFYLINFLMHMVSFTHLPIVACMVPWQHDGQCYYFPRALRMCRLLLSHPIMKTCICSVCSLQRHSFAWSVPPAAPAALPMRARECSLHTFRAHQSCSTDITAATVSQTCDVSTPLVAKQWC